MNPQFPGSCFVRIISLGWRLVYMEFMTETAPKLTVLLVEDTLSLARTYKKYLRDQPYDLVHVETGGAAIQALEPSATYASNRSDSVKRVCNVNTPPNEWPSSTRSPDAG